MEETIPPGHTSQGMNQGPHIAGPQGGVSFGASLGNCSRNKSVTSCTKMEFPRGSLSRAANYNSFSKGEESKREGQPFKDDSVNLNRETLRRLTPAEMSDKRGGRGLGGRLNVISVGGSA
ncbi:hypothetical protein KY285_010371 [Solanum tuberosum]|nr:hypothetical protein KY289_010915 [Solanum tuberosum]KAH0734664.1 hypothetical protein KY285_010371 [Solanum tuberosum]